MKPIRIGFVGLGGICRQRHVPGLRNIEGVELVAVANRSRASSEQAAREFGIPDVCDSWEELVARSDLDAVFIGTWPYMHCPMSVAALKAGKHVFCQARMAMNEPEAKEMRDCARASGRVAALCPVPIGLSVDGTIARLLREGRLGHVLLVRVQSFSDAFIKPDTLMSWRKDARLSGLNMHTLGMFVEVIHRWFGMTRRVAAMAQTFVRERVDASGQLAAVDIPDQVLLNAEMQAGFPVQYIFSTAALHGSDVIEIYSTEATLRYEVGQDVLYELGPHGTATPMSVASEDVYDVTNWRVERDFIDAIRLGHAYHPDFEYGYRYMQVVQAVHDSVAVSATVDI